jgi:hypothetical protein
LFPSQPVQSQLQTYRNSTRGTAAGAMFWATHMTARPPHDSPEQNLPISDRVAQHIASGFSLPRADVMQEARLVSAWGAGSSDDLLVWLEQRHNWPARRALLYLFSLHGALKHRFEFN